MTGTRAAFAVATSTVVSPIMMARCGSPPARRTAPVRWPGSGFETGKRVASGQRREEMVDLEHLEQRPREVLALVRAHRETRPGIAEFHERADRTRERPALDRDVCLVIDEEAFQEPFDIGIRQRRAGLPEPLDDHVPGAAPDVRSDDAVRDGTEAEVGERMVGRGNQVRGGVDKRAVEIEDESEFAHEASEKLAQDVNLAARPCHAIDLVRLESAAPGA